MIQLSGVLFYNVFNEENHVVIPDTMAEKCIGYAQERQIKDAAWYAKVRGGYPPTVADLWNYKAAECAVSQFMHNNFDLPLIEPDFNIYERGKKNWDSDLEYDNVNFLSKAYNSLKLGVKSSCRASQSRGFPPSYLYQATDEVFKQGNDSNWYAFVYVPHLKPVTKGADFYIQAVVSFPYLKDNNLFRDTFKQFKQLKYAVYIEHLENSLKRNPAVA